MTTTYGFGFDLGRPQQWSPHCPDRGASHLARHRARHPRHRRTLRPRCPDRALNIITTALSLFIVHEAYQLGAPGHVIARMLGNVALDGVFGAVPVVGDAFDVLWRANRRNVRLLREWLEHERRR
jgi:hypothetical protein